MNQTTPQATPFVESIRWLEARSESVPVGRQLAYNAMLCKLMAADCPARADITVVGPFLDDLNLRVTQSAFDPVVAGILRRVERAGPRLASLALTRVLRDLDETANGSPSEEIWWSAAPVQLRPLIPASAWQVLHLDGAPSSIHCTNNARLEKHKPWLEAVRRALDEASEADHVE